ncbi:MAG: hypothetical protein M1484_01295 [Patescibacteria group bacterium]|nr:hypothetical protein [Patescibacteria group bacterium]MCL5431716.1 hypothetical protein [Patescibacteria group bacterium]
MVDAIKDKGQGEVGKPDIKVAFDKLPRQSQGLLISMTHFPSASGGTREAVLAISGLDEAELDKALADLSKFGLVQKGKLVGEGRDKRLVEDGNGDRFSLEAETKAGVFEKILEMPFNKEDPLF